MSRRREFRKWLAHKPRAVKVLAASLKPWHDYAIKATGQLCVLRGFHEDGSITVLTSDRFGFVKYQVFGLRKGDLRRAYRYETEMP